MSRTKTSPDEDLRWDEDEEKEEATPTKSTRRTVMLLKGYEISQKAESSFYKYVITSLHLHT